MVKEILQSLLDLLFDIASLGAIVSWLAGAFFMLLAFDNRRPDVRPWVVWANPFSFLMPKKYLTEKGQQYHRWSRWALLAFICFWAAGLAIGLASAGIAFFL